MNPELTPKFAELNRLFDELCRHLTEASADGVPPQLRGEVEQFLVQYREAHQGFLAECEKADAEADALQAEGERLSAEAEAHRAEAQRREREEAAAPTPPPPADEVDPALGPRLREEVLRCYVWPPDDQAGPAGEDREVWEMPSQEWKSDVRPAPPPTPNVPTPPTARHVAPPKAPPPQGKPADDGEDAWGISSGEWRKDDE